ncbi:MAG TPA: urease accessory UreF family protein [Roseiarcus sp.]
MIAATGETTITSMITARTMPTTIASMGTTATEDDGGAPLPLLLWLSPGFPVGAFAYSHGLEWAVEAGDIADARSLQAWLIDLIDFGAPRSDAILFSVAFRSAAAADWPALIEANALAVALGPSAERRLETTAQGAAFVAAARAAWDCEPLRRLDRAPEELIAYPIAVAAAASGHGLPLRASLEAFALAQAANLVSAALRLGPIGQTDGQRVLAALLPAIRALARAVHGASLSDLGGAAFRSDIAAMRHESQYSRLFRT